jgi:hypothetical protein
VVCVFRFVDDDAKMWVCETKAQIEQSSIDGACRTLTFVNISLQPYSTKGFRAFAPKRNAR